MAKGWIASVGAGTALFTVKRMTVGNAVDPVEGVDDDSHCEAAKQIVGPSFELIAYNWRTALFTPVYYVGADHALGWIVISVRGTLHPNDIFTDVCAEVQTFDSGLVHLGVLKSALRLIDMIRRPLARALRAFPAYRVVACGHSLGGAIASLATALLRSQCESLSESFLTSTASGSEERTNPERFNETTAVERDGAVSEQQMESSVGTNTIGTTKNESRHRLQVQLAEIRCFTIGPLASFTSNLAEGLLRPFTTSAILGCDPAPRISVSAAIDLTRELSELTIIESMRRGFNAFSEGVVNTFTRNNNNDGDQVPKTDEGSVKNNENSSSKHNTDRLAAVSKVATREETESEEKPIDALNVKLLPPGVIYLFDDDDAMGLGADSIVKTGSDDSPGSAPGKGSTNASSVRGTGRGFGAGSDEYSASSSDSGGAAGSSKDTTQSGSSAPIFAVEAMPSDFDRILLSWTLMGYHLPQRYLRAILAASAVAPATANLVPGADADDGGVDSSALVVTLLSWSQRFAHIGFNAKL